MIVFVWKDARLEDHLGGTLGFRLRLWPNSRGTPERQGGDPEKTQVAFLQADPGSRASQHIELVAQREVLKVEALSRSEYPAEQE